MMIHGETMYTQWWITALFSLGETSQRILISIQIYEDSMIHYCLTLIKFKYIRRVSWVIIQMWNLKEKAMCNEPVTE